MVTLKRGQVSHDPESVEENIYTGVRATRGRRGFELFSDERVRYDINIPADRQSVWILVYPFEELTTEHGVFAPTKYIMSFWVRHGIKFGVTQYGKHR